MSTGYSIVRNSSRARCTRSRCGGSRESSGASISVAIEQLSKKYLHHREGLTGVLDYTLEKYLAEVEPTGVSFIDWIDSDAYDPKAIRAEFKAGWWGTVLTDKLLRRE